MQLKTKEYIATAMWVIGGSLYLSGMVLTTINIAFYPYGDVAWPIGLALFFTGIYWVFDIQSKQLDAMFAKQKERHAEFRKELEKTKITVEDVRKMSEILTKMPDEDVECLLKAFHKLHEAGTLKEATQ